MGLAGDGTVEVAYLVTIPFSFFIFLSSLSQPLVALQQLPCAATIPLSNRLALHSPIRVKALDTPHPR